MEKYQTKIVFRVKQQSKQKVKKQVSRINLALRKSVVAVTN